MKNIVLNTIEATSIDSTSFCESRWIQTRLFKFEKTNIRNKTGLLSGKETAAITNEISVIMSKIITNLVIKWSTIALTYARSWLEKVD